MYRSIFGPDQGRKCSLDFEIGRVETWSSGGKGMIRTDRTRYVFYRADLAHGYEPQIGDQMRFEPATTLKLHHLARNVRRDWFARQIAIEQ
jgi:hypothetical protein